MLVPGNSGDNQVTRDNFKFMFETGNFSIILRLLWHVIFLPITNAVSLCCFLLPQNIFWLYAVAVFCFECTPCVLSEKITLCYKLPGQLLAMTGHDFLLFQLYGVEIMSSALLPKVSVQVLS